MTSERKWSRFSATPSTMDPRTVVRLAGPHVRGLEGGPCALFRHVLLLTYVSRWWFRNVSRRVRDDHQYRRVVPQWYYSLSSSVRYTKHTMLHRSSGWEIKYLFAVSTFAEQGCPQRQASVSGFCPWIGVSSPGGPPLAVSMYVVVGRTCNTAQYINVAVLEVAWVVCSRASLCTTDTRRHT